MTEEDLKLLIVDDSKVIRKTIQRIVDTSDTPIRIVGEAVNGIEAIKLYKRLRPGIVTMDLTMPEMDGITCIEEIMKIDDAARILVISSLNAKDMIMDAIKKGARGYILKPFTEDKLLGALMEIA